MADSPSVVGVGWAGTVLSILLYMSQLPLMRRLVREGDATLPGYSYLPVLGQIAQAGPWCGYAICIQPTVALLTANFVGVGLGLLYLVVFAVYTPTWIGRLTIAASGTLVCGAIVAFYALLFSSATGPAYATAVQIAGIATVVVNQGFWVVPFLGLWRAARTLDTTRTSLALSGFQLVALSVWAAYGVVLRDVYVQGNCFTASCLGFLQCCAIIWIWRLQAQRGVGADGLPRVKEAQAAATEAESSSPRAMPASESDSVLVEVEGAAVKGSEPLPAATLADLPLAAEGSATSSVTSTDAPPLPPVTPGASSEAAAGTPLSEALLTQPLSTPTT